MKVFWAWQSDTPGSVGRHFVRKALEQAISDLKTEQIDIIEAPRGLELDHDRKGIPGSPDLAQAILQKIDSSAVVVADVTTVGRTEQGKAVPNPNVMIELGYALARLGDRRLLMVANEATSRREDLPFDLRHKAGPIFYNLEQGAPDSVRQECQKNLIGILKSHLRECLKQFQESPLSNEHETFTEAPSRRTAAEYYEAGESLVASENSWRTATTFTTQNLLYLRLIPTAPTKVLRNSDLIAIAQQHLKPFTDPQGTQTTHSANSYGAIRLAWSPDDKDRGIVASTQIFRSRELWGVDSAIVASNNGVRVLPMERFERDVSVALRHYVEVARTHLGLSCPLRIRAGASQSRGIRLHIRNLWPGEYYGEVVQQDEIRSDQTLQSFDAKEVDRVLLAIFQDFFDAAYLSRPDDFNGFRPPQ